MSPASFIRSAARGTFSAYRRLPIRWRLAGGSAVLTLVILLGFAAIVGVLTSRTIRTDFNEKVADAASDISARTSIFVRSGQAPICRGPNLNDYSRAEHAHIRVLTLDGDLLCQTRGAPDFGLPRVRTMQAEGYRVESRLVRVTPAGQAILQYARPYSDIDHTLRKVRVFLVLGVLGGAGLALLAGLFTARRAMRPIANLTSATREIERTRDPTLRIPHPAAEDEIAELARTLEDMLSALDAARSDTERMLLRQRAFVADASHELRTPLTSVLANLELLADQLEGEQAEATGSALRSAHRMRRLVGDLLLLARADAGRTSPHDTTDLGAVLEEAVGEVEPLAADHVVSVDAAQAMVEGARDELHRMAVNLLENAVRHTPPGTAVRASVSHEGDDAVLCVEDDGPGIPADLAPRIFERFVRGGGERAGSSGLGLAIVRAVAESHGGTVALESGANDRGARFVVRLPASRREAPAAVAAA